jgi:3,4-dihydroxy 2-butanone 4-phosphate synthase / GTP cyclohydrolase II
LPFSPIPEAIEELKAGRMIVLTDDEDRENEGDLVALADHITPEQINFMLREGRGVLCLALSPEICSRLSLDLQSHESQNRFGTAFTITIDAAEGVTTGVSAKDRWVTIRAAIHPETRPEGLVRPGHIFPLRARRGGVLVRPGQTEGSVDLARLCGTAEAAVIIEILNEDGTMARVPDLETFIARHRIKMFSIADLIEYRRKTEKIVRRVASSKLPTRWGEFDVHLYSSPYDKDGHLVLARGLTMPKGEGPGPPISEPVIGRIHSECLTGDVLGSLRCDCGEQLHLAMERIAREERGFLLYMRQEGRGIGLENKLLAYSLQDHEGLDTVEANARLGFKPDERNYGTGAQILYDLGIRKLRLLTNNPAKRKGLAGYGLEIVERLPIEVPPNAANHNYLATKRQKLGHMIGGVEDLEVAP